MQTDACSERWNWRWWWCKWKLEEFPIKRWWLPTAVGSFVSVFTDGNAFAVVLKSKKDIFFSLRTEFFIFVIFKPKFNQARHFPLTLWWLLVARKNLVPKPALYYVEYYILFHIGNDLALLVLKICYRQPAQGTTFEMFRPLLFITNNVVQQ